MSTDLLDFEYLNTLDTWLLAWFLPVPTCQQSSKGVKVKTQPTASYQPGNRLDISNTANSDNSLPKSTNNLEF